MVLRAFLRDERPWWHRAACAGKPTDWWYPDSSYRNRTTIQPGEAKALRICAMCPVRRECLMDALTMKRPVYHIRKRGGVELKWRQGEPDGIRAGVAPGQRSKYARASREELEVAADILLARAMNRARSKGLVRDEEVA